MQITIELKDKEVTRMSSMRAERVGEQMKKELMDIINTKSKILELVLLQLQMLF